MSKCDSSSSWILVLRDRLHYSKGGVEGVIVCALTAENSRPAYGRSCVLAAPSVSVFVLLY